MRDIYHLDLTPYDMVISDFEPLSAWAAKLKNVDSIGLSHQASFINGAPMVGSKLLDKTIVRWFAPTQHPIGIHWHQFDGIIMPPILEPHRQNDLYHTHNKDNDKILVYLPFHNIEHIIELLAPLRHMKFEVFHKGTWLNTPEHIHLNGYSRVRFQRCLNQAKGVICSAGFELPSEAISLGKSLLVEPMEGQFEQQSNALALEQIRLARVCKRLKASEIADWYKTLRCARVSFPDVANAIAQWISMGANPNRLETLSDELWQKTTMRQHTTLSPQRIINTVSEIAS